MSKKNESVKVYYIAIVFLAASFFVLNFLLRQGGEQRTKAAGETISLKFNPTSASATTGNTFSPAIQVQPSTSLSIRGFDIKVTFDPGKAEVTGIKYESPSVVSLGLGDDDSNLSRINQTGSINLQGEIQTPAGMALSSSSYSNLIVLSFNSKTSSAFSITVQSNGTKAYKINADKSIVPIAMSGATLNVNGGGGNPTPTPTTGGGNPTRTPTPGGGNPTLTPTPTTGGGNPTRTPTPTTGGGNPTRTPTPTTGSGNPTRTPTPTTGSGNPTRTPTPTTGGGNPTRTPTPTTSQGGPMNLDLELRFQGILRAPSNVRTMKVKVSITGGPLGNQIQSKFVDFSVENDGIWRGVAGFDAPAGDGYKVLIKGPKHLQKRICDNMPTETYGGTYRCSDTGKITLNQGANLLDFSNIIQLTGDLPDQNGVVDSYDISFIRLNLGSSAANAVATADLNLDGIVDTQDYALLIASLNIKYDEL